MERNSEVDRNSNSVSDSTDISDGRICRLTTRSDFKGYGFVLHSRKKTIGHYIAEVEKASPAEQSGLLAGDRLISVNGRCVRDISHKQVIEHIRELPNEVTLLLLDRKTDHAYTVMAANKSKTDWESAQMKRQRFGLNNKEMAFDDDSQNGQFLKLSDEEAVVGVTSVDDKLYVLVGQHDIRLLVFDTSCDYRECRRLPVPGVRRPIDITSCSRHRCLYIANCEQDCVHRVAVIDVMMSSSSNDNESNLKSTSWMVGDAPSGISVTQSVGRVLVTCSNSSRIKQFTADGQLVSVLNLRLPRPYHALRVVSGQLIVCHGGAPDSIHGVSVAEEVNGWPVYTYGEKRGAATGRMNTPWHLAVDERSPGDSSIYVADFKNGRVLKLKMNPSSGLSFSKILMSRDRRDGWLWLPFRLFVDTGRRVLYVAENRLSEDYDFSSSRIAIIRI